MTGWRKWLTGRWTERRKLDNSSFSAGKLPPADVAILAAAVAAQPDYFVTGDSHFLENTDIAAETGLRIATPSQFLKLLEQDGEMSHDGK